MQEVFHYSRSTEAMLRSLSIGNATFIMMQIGPCQVAEAANGAEGLCCAKGSYHCPQDERVACAEIFRRGEDGANKSALPRACRPHQMRSIPLFGGRRSWGTKVHGGMHSFTDFYSESLALILLNGDR